MPALVCGAGIKKVRLSPDGSRIATLLDDGSVSFWDALTAKPLPFEVREDGQLNDMLWGPVGLRFATVSGGGRGGHVGVALLWVTDTHQPDGAPFHTSAP